MKKFIAIMLCLAMLVSVVALTISAAETAKDTGSLGVSVADMLRPYGITPTFVPDNATTAPTMDGVVNENEYTSKRVMEQLKDNGTTIDTNVNFGGGCWPSAGNTVTEYVAQDEENIYVAFVYSENVTSVDWRYNLSQSAIFDGFAVNNCGGIKIKLPYDKNNPAKTVDFIKDGYNACSVGDIAITGGAGINGDADFSFKTLKYGDNPLTGEITEPDEFDAVAKRNYEGSTIKNVTAEFRLSKAAVMKATKEAETKIDSIGYYCFAERPGTNAVILQTYLPGDRLMDDGYTSADAFLLENYSERAATYYASNWRMVRYICFHADTYVANNPATMPAELMDGFTLATQATNEPTSEETSVTEETTDAEEEETTVTTVKTTVVTTEEAKGGCGNSIALSALAIVPVLGLGVAVVSKKKED